MEEGSLEPSERSCLHVSAAGAAQGTTCVRRAARLQAVSMSAALGRAVRRLFRSMPRDIPGYNLNACASGTLRFLRDHCPSWLEETENRTDRHEAINGFKPLI